MEQIPQERLIVTDLRQFGDHTCVEFMRVPRPEVGQPPPFQPTPQRLDGVEHRCIRRQPLQLQPIGELPHQITDRVAFVHRAAVPDDHETPGQILQHGLQEGRHVPAIEVTVVQGPGEQAQPITAGRQPHRRGDRDLLAASALLHQLGGLPTRRPGPPRQRSHQQAALVDQGEVGALPPGFFLMRGQSDFSHAAIATGSRSRGTRSGFWGVNPRSRSQALRYLGLRPTPNSSRINCPNRAAVQSSVSKPWCVGLSVNQRRAIFSWVEVSLAGRPETGLITLPAAPRSRKAANHRRTVEGTTPRKSATSWVEYPSATRWTASRLLYSNSSAEPGVLMQDSLRQATTGVHYFHDSQ